MVTICMITYNHEKYISAAIEGIFMQQTSFPYNLVIGDDCSTDNTVQIINNYILRYPKSIKLIRRDRNIGAISNFVETLNKCTGKYIALCEGDDYWTHSKKLQKQVDFLEKNVNYSLCFHNALVKHEGRKKIDTLFCENTLPEILNTIDLINKFTIPTASMVFRKSKLITPNWMRYIYNGDYALSLILSLGGHIKYLNESMSVYRKNEGGLNAANRNSYILPRILELLTYYDYYTEFKYHTLIIQRKTELLEMIPSILETEKNKIEKLFTFAFYKRKMIKLLNLKS